MPEDIQELKAYLENMREQCILGNCCADLDVQDMTVLLGMIDKYEKLEKEIGHWKKCTDNEQKIAGKLQRKVERYERALKRIASCEFDGWSGSDVLEKVVDFAIDTLNSR